MEDKDIIALFWERAENAISAVASKYGPYCFRIAYNILFSREDSDECVNDTYLRAWNAIPPQRPEILRAFLGKITRNLALGRYERERAAKRGGGQTSLCLDELTECLASKDSPESLTDATLLKECINSFISQLGEDERKVFVSRYWYMTPVRDIAKALSFGESKVKMMLLRTREKLKERLLAEGFCV